MRMTIAERRARLAVRHLLAHAHRAASGRDVASALVAVHSSDPVTVFLSVRARAPEIRALDLERELYVERSLVRMLGMRRTLFVVERELVPVVAAACTSAVAAVERRRLERFVAASGVSRHPARWLERAETAAVAVLEARGAAFTSEVAEADPLLATPVVIGAGRWAQTVTAATRVLPLLAAEGRIVRGPPRGTWVSSQYRWEPISVLGEVEPLDPAAARVTLLRRWLASYGPAREADIRWWTGWTARETREALAALPHVAVDLAGHPAIVLADDLEPVPVPAPSAALLPSLDSTVMGWKERRWYLGEEGTRLFDGNGNAGPTVWWDGRVVGGWTQLRSGEIAYRLLEDVGSDGSAAIDAEAERLAAWLGDIRVRPRFPTPVQAELEGRDGTSRARPRGSRSASSPPPT